VFYSFLYFPQASTDLGAAGAFLDADFVNQLLSSVDVDQNDPLIQAALAQMEGKRCVYVLLCVKIP
jgi:hypothetical protein